MSNYGKLRVWTESNLLQEHELAQDTLTIGRAPDNDLVLHNPYISRYQARLHYDGQHWTLENASKNVPVVFQGNAISGQVTLKSGDRFEFGEMQFELEQKTDAQAQPRPTIMLKKAPETIVQDLSETQPAPQSSPAQQPPAQQPPAQQPPAQQPPAQQSPRTVMVSAAPMLKVTYATNEQGTLSNTYPLTEPHMTIGRSSDNTIVIPVSTVSRQHASLKLDAQGYTIVDEGSTNGLLYQGSLTPERRLVDGDIIRIDDDLGNFVSLTYLDPARPAPKQVKDVRFAAGQQEVTIGRASDNVIVLDHPQVSSHHAVIKRGPQGATVQDLGSTNGTYVRGQRVTHSPLQPGDTLQIALFQLVYQDDGLVQTDADTIRLDAIHLRKAVNKDTLVLLDNISLSIYPKELVAIVGGSGAGKSTLMNALSGFHPAPEGTVLFNGDDYYQNLAAYRNSLGYVPQDDIIHRDLTVEQTLYYAARLRLPRDLSDAEIAERVDTVLHNVEMSAFRSSEVARLSGGQRKRVSIAVELLSKPRLFFLDEPLTGLDPGISKRMMSMLRRLADKGQTVVLITHATSSITVCDKLVVLGRGGKLCFYGTPQEALEFFEVENFADIYAKLSQNANSSEEWQERFRQSAYYGDNVLGRIAEVAPNVVQAGQNGAPQTANSQVASGGVQPTPVVPASEQRDRSAVKTAKQANKPSRIQQFALLTRRYFAIMRHDKINLLLMLASAPIIGLIIALVANAAVFADGTPPSDAQRVVFLLAIASVFLGANSAAQELTREAPIYLRERLVSLRVMPYIMSKFVVLMLLSLVQSTLLVGVVVLGTGIPPEGAILPGLIELLIGVWLTMLSGVAMGLLISSWAPNTDVAISIVPVLLVFQIMLAGLIFPLNGCMRLSESPRFELCLDAISYPIAAKWSTDSMGTTANVNRLYYQDMAMAPPGIRPLSLPMTLPNFDTADYDSGFQRYNEDVYSVEVHQQSRRIHLLGRWGVLVGMIVLFLILAGISQRRKDRIWQVR
jgi:ABC-type multidrug transport system ATPase subunit/pSer/pThr/pTyr-binding forkhead associated (FHA) protein